MSLIMIRHIRMRPTGHAWPSPRYNEGNGSNCLTITADNVVRLYQY